MGAPPLHEFLAGLAGEFEKGTDGARFSLAEARHIAHELRNYAWNCMNELCQVKPVTEPKPAGEREPE
jgi:hypothetical protein